MRLIDPQVVELIGISGLGKTQDAGSLRRRTCAIYSLIISNETGSRPFTLARIICAWMDQWISWPCVQW